MEMVIGIIMGCLIIKEKYLNQIFDEGKTLGN